MDAIFSKLTEIEDAANRILDRTAQQKKAASEELKRKIAALDEELEQQLNKKIDAERESLQRQREEKLQSITENAEKQMSVMEEQVRSRHEELARDIMNRILEA